MEVLQQIAGQLGLDQSFYPLFGLMVVLYFILSNVYLKPFQKVLHERREQTEGAKKEAHELMTRADEKYTTYKSRLKEAHDHARRVLGQTEDQAHKEEARVIGEAASEAKGTLQKIQADLEKDKRTVLEALSKDIPVLAGEIATKVLGRPVNR